MQLSFTDILKSGFEPGKSVLDVSFALLVPDLPYTWVFYLIVPCFWKFRANFFALKSPTILRRFWTTTFLWQRDEDLETLLRMVVDPTSPRISNIKVMWNLMWSKNHLVVNLMRICFSFVIGERLLSLLGQVSWPCCFGSLTSWTLC